MMYSDGGKKRQHPAAPVHSGTSADQPGRGASAPAAAGIVRPATAQERDSLDRQEQASEAVAPRRRQRRARHDERERDADHHLPEQPLSAIEPARRSRSAIGARKTTAPGSQKTMTTACSRSGQQRRSPVIIAPPCSELKVDEIRSAEVTEEHREVERSGVDGVSHADRQPPAPPARRRTRPRRRERRAVAPYRGVAARARRGRSRWPARSRTTRLPVRSAGSARPTGRGRSATHSR